MALRSAGWCRSIASPLARKVEPATKGRLSPAKAAPSPAPPPWPWRSPAAAAKPAPARPATPKQPRPKLATPAPAATTRRPPPATGRTPLGPATNSPARTSRRWRPALTAHLCPIHGFSATAALGRQPKDAFPRSISMSSANGRQLSCVGGEIFGPPARGAPKKIQRTAPVIAARPRVWKTWPHPGRSLKKRLIA